MGFRFRKSINLGGGVRLNVSKKGVGMSAGVKGLRVGVGPRGVRTTASIPGTGMSYTNQQGLGSTRKTNNKLTNSAPSHSSYQLKNYKGQNWTIGIILGIILLIITPVLGFPLLLLSSFVLYKVFKRPETKSILEYNKGIKNINKNKHIDAIDNLNNAINYNADNHEAHSLLALLHNDHTKDYKKALEHAKKSFQNQAVNPMIQFIAGNSYFQTKQYDNAIIMLQQIPEESQFFYKKTFLLGLSFYAKGSYELAAEQFKLGPVNKRNIDDEVLKWKYWLGLSYYRSGNKTKAKTQLTKVYSVNMNYENIQSIATELGFN